MLRLQTGVPTDRIARLMRVKRVGRDDGARRMRSNNEGERDTQIHHSLSVS